MTAQQQAPDAPARLLDAQGVRFGYTETAVLRGLDVHVEAGELVGILGCNGSGKSTLLKLVVGPEAIEHRAWDGALRLGGDDARSLASQARARRVAYVPQDIPIALALSVEEVVALGRHPHQGRWGWLAGPDDDRAVIHDAMRTSGVWAMRDRPYGSLSGGERQRVWLAAALAQQAPLLLLDEPTSALDLHHGLRLLALLRDHVRTHKHAALIASHDLNLAARFCDRVVVLHEGRSVADGPPADVLTPTLLRRVYRIEAAVVPAPDRAAPLIVPLRALDPTPAPS